VGELAGQSVVVRREAGHVGLAQLDVERVGHQTPVTAEDLRVVVELALQRGRDLHRLDRTAEGSGEDPGDPLPQLVFEALQSAHGLLLPRAVPRLVFGGCGHASTWWRHTPRGDAIGATFSDGWISSAVWAIEPAWDNVAPASSASGGIGRRARFRSVCP